METIERINGLICLLLRNGKTVIGSWRTLSYDDPVFENALMLKKLPHRRWPDGTLVDAPGVTREFGLVPLDGNDGPARIVIHNPDSIILSYDPGTRLSHLYAQHMKLAFEAIRKPDGKPPSEKGFV